MLVLVVISGVVGCGEKMESMPVFEPSLTDPDQGVVLTKTLVKLTRKADAGDVLAMVELGKFYDLGRNWGKPIQFFYIEPRGGSDPLIDYDKASAWYEKAAKHGNAESLGRLGRLFYSGRGVQKDFAKAFDLFQSAALQGDVIAQYGLGLIYLNGDGVSTDEVKGRELIEKSAAQNLPDAQNLVGVWHEEGFLGYSKNIGKAVEWWHKAAAKGHSRAQLSLGQAYRSGNGVPQDTVRAVEWFTKSAAQGNTIAQFFLGLEYAKSKGVMADAVLAYAWLNLAAGNALEVAGEMRDRVARKMSPSDIAEAQQMSSRWKIGETLARESGGAAEPRQPKSPGRLTKQGSATIFVVSKAGHAITNQHVTTGCSEIRIQGREQVAKLITEDSVNDLALVQMPATTTDAASIAFEPSKLRQGEDVIVFGFPLNSLLSSAGNLTPGVVSALSGLGNNTSQIQITAPIQPGSSGSPVLNKKGEVVGVVSLKLSDSKMVAATGSVGQNVNFAVSGQTLKTFLDMNQVPYSTGGYFSREKSRADLADVARKWTMLVECWR